MMNAREARTMTEQAIAREIEDRQTRANEFCEELTKAIAETANNKQSIIEGIIVPIDIIAYVCRILKDNGYEVRRNTSVEITVLW